MSQPPHWGSPVAPRPAPQGALVVALVCAVVVTLAAGATLLYLRRDTTPPASATSSRSTGTPTPTPSPSRGGHAIAQEPSVDCGYRPLNPSATVTAVAPPDGRDVAHTGVRSARLETNFGTVTLELEQSAAPCSVNSWVHLAEQHFYSGTTCHRSTAVLLQCGDPSGTGQGGASYQYRATEGLPTQRHPTYPRGTLAMATNSNRLVGSQFFLTATDLDIAPASPVVGRITEGIEVLDAILALGNDASLEPTPGGGRPSAEVHLESLVVSEAR